jgi:hypothetical protein
MRALLEAVRLFIEVVRLLLEAVRIIVQTTRGLVQAVRELSEMYKKIVLYIPWEGLNRGPENAIKGRKIVVMAMKVPVELGRGHERAHGVREGAK